jgi:hypothetical protein
MQPNLEVLGVYIPSADRGRLRQFIQGCLERYSDVPVARLREIEESYAVSLDEVVLIDVLVLYPDQRFSVGAFTQPDPKLDPGYWKVAWDEVFLTTDGEAKIDCSSFETPHLPSYRVVFWLHEWRPELGLESSYGRLECPSPQAVPERLWAFVDFYVD